MKIYSNEKLIKRNKKIGNFTSLGSILILGVGMFFSFKDKDGSYLAYTFGALIVGFLLFQIGNFYMSKWGKSPRPDERLTAALKGLDDRYSLYHYTTPISHLLIGPAGILCLIPYQQAGTITYNEAKGKWKQTGGNAFLKVFGGEGLGHPEREVKFTIEDAAKYFVKNEFNTRYLSPEPVMVFTNDRVVLEAEGSEIPAVTGAKLKEYIRKKAKTTALPDQFVRELQEKLAT